MAERVAVVTDSTASLPQEVAARAGVTTVPLQVVIDGEDYDDGPPETSEILLEAFEKRLPVTTSRVVPSTFAAVYADLAAAGATSVISVHLSGRLSGTCESAVLAAREAPIPVRVVDSGLITMGLGLAVLDVAALARRLSGAGAAAGIADAAAEAVARRAARTSTLFYVDDLDYLRRGGRIGPTQAFLGTALAVKPLLHLADGRIEPLEKVRTATRALARLTELAADRVAGRSTHLSVHHLAAAERARALAERLGERLPDVATPPVSELTSVLAAHVGPGTVGVVIAPGLPEAADPDAGVPHPL